MSTDSQNHRRPANLQQATTGSSSAPPTASQASLDDQAATAAVFVTHTHRNVAIDNRQTVLTDKDLKLSVAGAATSSLKCANPKNLPTFPSVGLPEVTSSAWTAATLGWNSRKSPEYWKPGAVSVSASTAALLANDSKMEHSSGPTESANGAKAAILAHKDGTPVSMSKPGKTDAGNTAAFQAFRSVSGPGSSSKVDYDFTSEATARKGSLLAATGAMKSNTRRRAGSTPIPTRHDYPDSVNSVTSNALNAATIAHKPSLSTSSIQHSEPSTLSVGASRRRTGRPKPNVSREMFTSNPPIALEVEEKKRADILKAAALSMAKQMYDAQLRLIDEASAKKPLSDTVRAATTVHGHRRSKSSPIDEALQPAAYENLQETARKLAAERLAKIRDEHASSRDYYGLSQPHHLSPRRLIGRRRSHSDGGCVDDIEQSRRIKSEMTLFNSKLADVDAQKQRKDREAILAAAKRNVAAQMHDLDEQIFQETGKLPLATRSEWKARANAIALANSEARTATHGKVDIGGGKYLDRAEVEAVASRNVQPLLDEINEKAEKDRAHKEELRAEHERKKQKEHEEKERKQEAKAEQKRLKDQEKQEEQRLKDEQKAAKAQEKAFVKEEKALSKEEKRKSKEASSEHKRAVTISGPITTNLALETAPERALDASPQDTAVQSINPAVTTHQAAPQATPPQAAPPQATPPQATPLQAAPSEAAPSEAAPSEAAPHQITHPFKPSAFPLPKPGPDSPTSISPTTPTAKVPPTAKSQPTSNQSSSTDSRVLSWIKRNIHRRSTAMKPLASPSPLHNNSSTDVTVPQQQQQQQQQQGSFIAKMVLMGASHTSLPRSNTAGGEAAVSRTSLQPSNTEASSVSSVSEGWRGRASDRDDEFEEARDTFDEGLALPPPLGKARGRIGESPVRESRFLENL